MNDHVQSIDFLLVRIIRRELRLPQPPLLHNLQLYPPKQPINRAQRRHRHPPRLALAQRLAHDGLDLHEVALVRVLAHARPERRVGRVGADDGLGRVGGQVHAVGGGRRRDLEHDGPDQVVDDVPAHAHARRVRAQHGRDRVVRGVVQELAPARVLHVGVEDDVELVLGVVDRHVAAGGFLCDFGRHAWVGEGPDLLGVGVVVEDLTVGCFRCADVGDAADDGVCWEARDERLLDVEAIL